MVQVRYNLIVYTKQNIPTRIAYTKNIIIMGEQVAELSGGTGEDDIDEYYTEYDGLGLFLYVNINKNKIIKNRTWVQDFKLVDIAGGNPTDYHPKTTIKYIEE
jgi:hypothetical protein